MKVCVISPGVVHAVPRTVAMAPYLDDVHFVDMLGTADRASLECAGVHYHRSTEGGCSRIASLNLQRLLARLAPDIIVCHYGLGDHFFNAIAYGRCPVSVIAMGSDVLDHGDSRVSRPCRLLSRMGLRRAAAISAKSRSIAAALRNLGVSARTEINYWGSDLTRFSPGGAARARSALGLPVRGPIVLSPRAIEPRLNIDLVVAAFADVVRSYPDAQLVILGRSMPSYRAAVEEQIAQLGLSDHVRVIGEVGQEELPLWYQASDVVVSVGSAEGFPNTVLEVMACGVPVLVGDIPQVRELLSEGVNARLCAIDAAAIADGILDLLTNRDRALEIAQSARSMASQVGDIAANGRRFAMSLNRIAQTADRSPAVPLLEFRAILIFYLVLKRYFHVFVEKAHRDYRAGKPGRHPTHATAGALK